MCPRNASPEPFASVPASGRHRGKMVNEAEFAAMKAAKKAAKSAKSAGTAGEAKKQQRSEERKKRKVGGESSGAAASSGTAPPDDDGAGADDSSSAAYAVVNAAAPSGPLHDKTISCVDCATDFVFSVAEQEFFLSQVRVVSVALPTAHRALLTAHRLTLTAHRSPLYVYRFGTPPGIALALHRACALPAAAAAAEHSLAALAFEGRMPTACLPLLSQGYVSGKSRCKECTRAKKARFGEATDAASRRLETTTCLACGQLGHNTKTCSSLVKVRPLAVP